MNTTDSNAVDNKAADVIPLAERVPPWRRKDEQPVILPEKSLDNSDAEQIASVEPSQPVRAIKPKSKSAARSQAEIVKLLYECTLTEDGLAEAFKAKHDAQLLYDHDSGLWYVYHKGV